MAAKTDDDAATVWEGYSDYQRVAQRIGMSVEDAVDAKSALKALHREGARVRAPRAAQARRDIEAAAMRMRVELEQDREEVDEYEEILTDWEGEEGYLALLDEVQLASDYPDWLDKFVNQIRRAGWELGYLQAGRSRRAEPDDPAEREAKSMLRD